LIVWSLLSQLSLGFETWTRPPTAATLGSVNRAISSRIGGRVHDHVGVDRDDELGVLSRTRG